MFGRIGALELVVIFAIVLVIFGPKKIPQLGKAIGGAIQNFRRGSAEETGKPEAEVSPEKKS